MRTPSRFENTNFFEPFHSCALARPWRHTVFAKDDYTSMLKNRLFSRQSSSVARVGET